MNLSEQCMVSSEALSTFVAISLHYKAFRERGGVGVCVLHTLLTAGMCVDVVKAWMLLNVDKGFNFVHLSIYWGESESENQFIL